MPANNSISTNCAVALLTFSVVFIVWQGINHSTSAVILLNRSRKNPTMLWELPSLSESMDVMVPTGAVDVGGRIVYPHPPSGRLPGYGGGRQFLSDIIMPSENGMFSGHTIRKPPISPKEAQAFFLARSIMDRHLVKKGPIVVPANAHWVGMMKDSHGQYHYADASGKEFDRSAGNLVAKKKYVKTSDGVISMDALQKAFTKASEILKAAKKPILHLEPSSTISVSKTETFGQKNIDDSHPEQSTESKSKHALEKAASALDQIATTLKSKDQSSDKLASVAKELADVSAKLGTSILAHQDAPKQAVKHFLKQAEPSPSITEHPAAQVQMATKKPFEHDSAAMDRPNGRLLNRELLIELDLHRKLFGRNGLCKRGTFRQSAVCTTLAKANWNNAWAKVVQDMGAL